VLFAAEQSGAGRRARDDLSDAGITARPSRTVKRIALL